MIVVCDSVMQDCIQFLENCEAFGRDVRTVVESPLDDIGWNDGRNTVTYEARHLKALLLKLQNY